MDSNQIGIIAFGVFVMLGSFDMTDVRVTWARITRKYQTFKNWMVNP